MPNPVITQFCTLNFTYGGIGHENEPKNFQSASLSGTCISDVSALLLEIGKPGSPSAERLAICDLNGDGVLSISDVSALLLML